MKIFALLAGAASAFSAEDVAFDKFVKDFDKKYASEEELNKRRAIFNDNLRYIIESNARGLSYELEVNEFSGWLVARLCGEK